jgi:hypothetical protein
MTLLETYVEALMAAFTGSGAGAKVVRSLVETFERDEGDVIAVHYGKEEPNNDMHGVTDRFRDIKVSVITRNPIPDKRAGEIMEVIHPLVVNFTAAGIIDVLEGPTDEPKYANTDGNACMITTHYIFHYRTQPDSLSA